MAENDPLVMQIDADLRDAMRNRDETGKLTLRSVKTALTEAAKAGENHTLNHETVLAVLQREAKRRREAAAEYQKVGEQSRAAQELAELAVLQRYLPQQMNEAEIEALARAAIAATGATSMRDMGKVMSAALAQADGKADGKLLSSTVKRLLGG